MSISRIITSASLALAMIGGAIALAPSDVDAAAKKMVVKAGQKGKNDNKGRGNDRPRPIFVKPAPKHSNPNPNPPSRKFPKPENAINREP